MSCEDWNIMIKDYQMECCLDGINLSWKFGWIILSNFKIFYPTDPPLLNQWLKFIYFYILLYFSFSLIFPSLPLFLQHQPNLKCQIEKDSVGGSKDGSSVTSTSSMEVQSVVVDPGRKASILYLVGPTCLVFYGS